MVPNVKPAFRILGTTDLQLTNVTVHQVSACYRPIGSFQYVCRRHSTMAQGAEEATDPAIKSKKWHQGTFDSGGATRTRYSQEDIG